MKKVLITSAVVFFACSLQAQFVYDYLKAADSYYKKVIMLLQQSTMRNT